MFFSPELLAKRDSGFGLLWMAATLSSKLKKLPKKSVLTADISQLCDLISEPAEPLALRLSSNLMVGVARVYKVKQDIFLLDVTNCATSLKKVVQEVQSSNNHMQLQMAQPTVRPAALNMLIDPNHGHIMDFDAFVADWDEYLNIREQDIDTAEADQDFNPAGRGKQQKGNRKPKSKTSALAPEDARADMHTLQEHHDHLLSASFDLSYNSGGGGGGGGGGLDPSSSQVEPTFPLDDLLLQAGDGLDLREGLGDDLARELGEGWGWGSPAKDIDVNANLGFEDPALNMDVDFNFRVHDSPAPAMDVDDAAPIRDSDGFVTPRTPSRKRKAPGFSRENSIQRFIDPPDHNLSPATSFSRLLLSQDEIGPILRDVTPINALQPPKKAKRARLLLDARTELTDEELRTARLDYTKRQEELRAAMNDKKFTKDDEKLIEDIIWGAPRGIQSSTLAGFWQENFKVQVQARTGLLHVHIPDQHVTKLSKAKRAKANEDGHDASPTNLEFALDQDRNDDYQTSMGIDFDGGVGMGDPFVANDLEQDPPRHSSEDPGQGRHNSRPRSILSKANFGLDIVDFQDPVASSQRSSLFPWDNAGIESSSSGVQGRFKGSDQIVVDRADIGLRGSSRSASRRGSPFVASQPGSAIGISPGKFGRSSQIIPDEDYNYDVGDLNESFPAIDSQQSDANMISLERNSFNFLEYTRMQQNSVPELSEGLSFDIIVPKDASTRHVAAAAFYHCLVLATKDLLRLKQLEPYGPVSIAVVG